MNQAKECYPKRMKKTRVAVLYGGRSGEHEVSLRSGASVIKNLDRALFDVIPVAIDHSGRWLLHSLGSLHYNGAHGGNAGKVTGEIPASLPVHESAAEVQIITRATDNRQSLLQVVREGGGTQSLPRHSVGDQIEIDIVFPVMHGPLCEDGTLQGMLELAEVAYVGCGVLASAVVMDKDMAKRVMRDAGIPIVPFFAVKADEYARDAQGWLSRVEKEFGFPCFVKPSNMGSSVGVHKAKTAADFALAMKDAFRYDTKVLIEKAIAAREIELSVLENSADSRAPWVSVAGEITPTHEFYSYESKYIDENGAHLRIPAALTPEQLKVAQDFARRAFVAFECEGLSRVDLFLDKNSGEFYINEANTLPGFTSISMYPKMWEASGVGYSELLTKLIELARLRHQRRLSLLREFKA